VQSSRRLGPRGFGDRFQTAAKEGARPLSVAGPIVKFKPDLLRAALPAETAAVFGDMYIVECG
jgi:hypothetical protein